MQVELRSDVPVTDEACQEATGKTLDEWFAWLDERKPEKRRETQWAMLEVIGRGAKPLGWCTTVWVEWERRIGRVTKDGRPEGYSICSTKTIAAPASTVQSEIARRLDTIVRQREGKSILASWHTPGVDHPTEVEVLLKETDGKTAVTLNHNRIQTREEADGLRRAWASELSAIKQALESA